MIRTWLIGAVLIALGLIAAVTVAASLITPDYGFHYAPTIPHGLALDRILAVLERNSLVLALHAFLHRGVHRGGDTAALGGAATGSRVIQRRRGRSPSAGSWR